MIRYAVWIAIALVIFGCTGTQQSYPIVPGTYEAQETADAFPHPSSLKIDTNSTTVTMHYDRTEEPTIHAKGKILDPNAWIVACQTNFTSDKLETWELTSPALPKTLYLSAGCNGSSEVLLYETKTPNGDNRFVVYKSVSSSFER